MQSRGQVLLSDIWVIRSGGHRKRLPYQCTCTAEGQNTNYYCTVQHFKAPREHGLLSLGCAQAPRHSGIYAVVCSTSLCILSTFPVTLGQDAVFWENSLEKSHTILLLFRCVSSTKRQDLLQDSCMYYFVLLRYPYWKQWGLWGLVEKDEWFSCCHFECPYIFLTTTLRTWQWMVVVLWHYEKSLKK